MSAGSEGRLPTRLVSALNSRRSLAGMDRPRLVESRRSPRGEVVLRRAGDQFEIISNGVFLMDTRDGRSERLLVRAAIERATRAYAPPAKGLRVLLGGLGVGFSLSEAMAEDAVGHVTVVEVEPAVVDWYSTYLAPRSSCALRDPRVRLVIADLVDWVRGARERFDVICLDVDNGPNWTVADGNAELYSARGLARLRALLRPGGVLAVWSSAPDRTFETSLREMFTDVTVETVEVARGEPDHVYLAGTVITGSR